MNVKNNVTLKKRLVKKALAGAAVLSLGLAISTDVLATPRDQAKRIHDRLAGVPPTNAVLTDMENDINGIGDGLGVADGTAKGAAYTAMENSAFYNVTLKNFAAPWTNRDQTVFVDLNDYIATVIGLVRDDEDFRQALYGDVIYIGNSSLGLPAYSNSNNNHYEQLESRGEDLKTALVQAPQSQVTGLPSSATAGLMTTRAAAQAFFIAGTNRAMLRFTLLNHLGRDLEQLKDNTLPADRIRQDVSRSPGGDSRIFLNNCVGCHTGMDPLAQAFAYYNFLYDPDNDPAGLNGQIQYNDVGATDPVTGTRVQEKYHINSTNFAPGFITPNDNWDNYWRVGTNSLLGWDTSLPGSGSGAKSMGMELANSRAFAEYQVVKVFRSVCLREPGDSADRQLVSDTADLFIADTYNMKTVFAEVAVYCMGP